MAYFRSKEVYTNKNSLKHHSFREFTEVDYFLCGPDGTRTRDLRRDRAAF